jgi:hypothetical protein
MHYTLYTIHYTLNTIYYILPYNARIRVCVRVSVCASGEKALLVNEGRAADAGCTALNARGAEISSGGRRPPSPPQELEVRAAGGRANF